MSTGEEELRQVIFGALDIPADNRPLVDLLKLAQDAGIEFDTEIGAQAIREEEYEEEEDDEEDDEEFLDGDSPSDVFRVIRPNCTNVNYSSMNVEQLRAECTRRDLAATGLRAEIVSRLKNYDEEGGIQPNGRGVEAEWFQGCEDTIERVKFTGPEPGLTEAGKQLGNSFSDCFFAQISKEFVRKGLVPATNEYAKEKEKLAQKKYKERLKKYNEDKTNNKKPRMRKHREEKDIPQATEEGTIAFFGILARMGFVPVKSASMYWKKDGTCNVPSITEVMSRNEFQFYMSNLHLPTDNSSTDPLRKIIALIIEMNRNAKLYYYVTRIVTIDEGMMATKSPLSSFRVYMKDKPVKWGIKVWMLVDENGYLYHFYIYTGKRADGNVTRNLGESVVENLVSELPKSAEGKGLGYEVIADNFFSSLNLAKKLRANDINYYGTIRKDRTGFSIIPWDMSKLKERGQSEHFSLRGDTSITGHCWKDSKHCFLLSNCHDPEAETNYTKMTRTGSKQIAMPMVAHDYRKGMGAVDGFNRNVSLYKTKKNCRRWWLVMFFYILDYAMVNAWRLYCIKHNVTITQFEYRCNLAHELIGTYRAKRISIKKPKFATISQVNLFIQTPGNYHPCECGNKHCCGSSIFKCIICGNYILNEPNHILTHGFLHVGAGHINITSSPAETAIVEFQDECAAPQLPRKRRKTRSIDYA